MKQTILAILLAAALPHAFADDDLVGLKQDAQKCAKALLSSDYNGVVTYTHKRVIAGLGGKEAMIATLNRGTDEMHAQGISFVRIDIGNPERPRKVGEWFIALVPQKTVMKVTGGHLEQESRLLGISEDNKKSWVFVDVGPISNEQFSQVFPELAGKIQLPEKKKPVFKRD